VRFTNDVHRSELHNPDDIFSPSELDLIRKMAEEMGAEFCEFDVLRDRTSDLIYVIDVNKTPYGPPNGLPKSDSLRAISILSESFRKAFVI
jgi:glutathione synthase/RimK-type ligase-like ATP-grasp enzyme